MAKPDDEWADRLMALLDTGLKALRAGDGEGAALALKQAVEEAQEREAARSGMHTDPRD